MDMKDDTLVPTRRIIVRGIVEKALKELIHLDILMSFNKTLMEKMKNKELPEDFDYSFAPVEQILMDISGNQLYWNEILARYQSHPSCADLPSKESMKQDIIFKQLEETRKQVIESDIFLGVDKSLKGKLEKGLIDKNIVGSFPFSSIEKRIKDNYTVYIVALEMLIFLKKLRDAYRHERLVTDMDLSTGGR
jgi:hypothetical protein